MNEQLETMLREIDKIKPGTMRESRELLSGFGPIGPTKDNPGE